jgi:hypothetical protein
MTCSKVLPIRLNPMTIQWVEAIARKDSTAVLSSGLK